MLVKIRDGIEMSQKAEPTSCPLGWKLFSPQSKTDWLTVIRSTTTLPKAPHLIVDVTRRQNGCPGCTAHAMNSNVTEQQSWKTTDGTPWWLRGERYTQPSGDYTKRCYMNIIQVSSDGNVDFDDRK